MREICDTEAAFGSEMNPIPPNNSLQLVRQLRALKFVGDFCEKQSERREVVSLRGILSSMFALILKSEPR